MYIVFKKRYTCNQKAGFTLIELLVVIAIIGTLASVVLASLNTARGKARDANRQSSLNQISKALEFYYNDCGSYIVRDGCTGAYYGSGGQGWFNDDYGAAGTVAEGLADMGYTGGEVTEPTGEDGYRYMIYVCNSGQRYAVSATLENPTAEHINHIQTTCNGIGGNGTYSRYGKNYAVGN
jgi:prepilin-type N-terminal cleavage/methylation domain-containing protein